MFRVGSVNTGSNVMRLLALKKSYTVKRWMVLTVENMNPNVRKMEYAVRGPIVIRAGHIEQELKQGHEKLFTDVIRANIGDCHATGQRPITFIRQVVALCCYPELMESDMLPQDAKSHAQRILDNCSGHSVGSYSDSCGLPLVRDDVAHYIAERDGFPCSADDVFLCTGASNGIKSILMLAMTGKGGEKRAGVMIPIPQYPLYSATISEYNAYQIGYYLNEDRGWALDVSELERAVEEARPLCVPRVLVVINPGNPTGQVLTKDNMQDVIRFAKDHNLFVMADEVYQHNVYSESAHFHSFKKVMMDMGGEYSDMELASFMSASKGYMGECGFRGGYAEVVNLDPQVRAMLMKSISAKLCSSVCGQAVLDTVVNPPCPGQQSYDTFIKERDGVLGELAEKAYMVTETFNSISGVTCNTLQGAMYAYPRIHLPDKVIRSAEAAGQSPDVYYCYRLLEETGICTVPGSGFGQVKGTYHFRTTILPTVKKLQEMLVRFKDFHLRLLGSNS